MQSGELCSNTWRWKEGRVKNKKIISSLYRVLQDLRGLEMLVCVGLKKNLTDGHIDLLAGCNGGDIYKYATLIEALLKGRWPSGNFSVCDDSVRFNLSTISGGIAICDPTLLARQIKEWTEGKNLGGQHRSWAIGYWLPEALCGDLATAEILYDATGICAQIRELIVPYPASLSHAIIDLCVDEIRQKIRILERLSEKDNPIELGLCISDLAASMMRFAFARSRRYFRGFKSLDEQARFLRSSDMPIYELALKLSKRKRTGNLIGEIKELV